MNRDEFNKTLHDIAAAMASASDGRLRLVKNEEDRTPDFASDADEFLKLDGVRLNRDLKVYTFMVAVGGAQLALAQFVEEIVFPCRSVVPESYPPAVELLLAAGRREFSGELLKAWEDMFDDAPAAPSPR